MLPARFDTANVNPSRMLILSAGMTGPLPRGGTRTLGRYCSDPRDFRCGPARSADRSFPDERLLAP
jgi:hypothetical protein